MYTKYNEILFLEYIEYKSIIAEYKLRCVYMIRVRQNSKNVVVREYTKYKYEILFLEYIEYKSIIAKYKLRCVYMIRVRQNSKNFTSEAVSRYTNKVETSRGESTTK